MHDNLLQIYMDKEKATIDNMRYCKSLTRKIENINAIWPWLYWAKVLTDHPKNAITFLSFNILEYILERSLKTQFGINRVYQQESGILHAVWACVYM